MATITEDYVSFETAKLLKDKGFDVPCMGRYSVRSKEFHLDCTRLCNNGGLFECSAPTHQMAMKWLREVHKLHIEPHIQSYKNYNGDIYNLDGELLLGFPSESPEQACETAILYCLKNLIK